VIPSSGNGIGVVKIGRRAALVPNVFLIRPSEPPHERRIGLRSFGSTHSENKVELIMKAPMVPGKAVSRATLLAAAVTMALLSSPASARRQANSNAGDSLRVDHDGIYLAQREGQCLAGGPCDLGGQCPGSEFVTGRYPNGPLYCGRPRYWLGYD
jgi:hypothetical protein